MPCNYPARAYRIGDSLGRPAGVVFQPKKGENILADIQVPCGQCQGCKQERQRQWAIRCANECQMHTTSLFITLTYDDDHLPDGQDLQYEDFQKFIKALRYKLAVKYKCGRKRKWRRIYPRIRYYVAGEYGDQNNRPHFHTILFGLDLPDKVLHQAKESGNLYTSKTIEEVWKKGFVTVGYANFATAAYIAAYISKKQKSDLSYEMLDTETGEVWYRQKEFNQMSRQPGIGSTWFEKFKGDVFPHDRSVLEGKAFKPPRYYTQKLKEQDPEEYERIQFLRYSKAKESAADNTEERLLVKEKVLKAKNEFYRTRKL